MAHYIAQRLVALVLLVFGISVLVFLIIRLIPGDPALVLLGTNAGDPVLVHRLHEQLGLDLPIPVQYVHWISGVVRGDFGYSYGQGLPVSTLIADNFPYTLQLTIAGLGLSIVLGVFLGVLAALHRNSIIDTLSMGLALIALSIPSFWLGLLLLILFSVKLHWFAVFGGTTLKGMVLPAVALALSGAGFTARFVRSSVIDARQRQHVTTARSKGLPRRRVLVRHVMRNAILPVLTVVGLQFGSLLSGTVVIETVFSRPGIGRVLVNAILAKDYLTIQAVVLLVAILYALTNLAVDLLYPILDPRIAQR
jgi:ABC-type dipeptide/oligopeptide/nickel transport system permease component